MLRCLHLQQHVRVGHGSHPLQQLLQLCNLAHPADCWPCRAGLGQCGACQCQPVGTLMFGSLPAHFPGITCMMVAPTAGLRPLGGCADVIPCVQPCSQPGLARDQRIACSVADHELDQPHCDACPRYLTGSLIMLVSSRALKALLINRLTSSGIGRPYVRALSLLAGSLHQLVHSSHVVGAIQRLCVFSP